MTDGSWDDYVDLSSVDATDPSTAVPAVSDEVVDFADTVDSLDAVSDLDQVTTDNAAYQTEVAVGDQSWADWNSDIATGAAGDAADYVDYGNEQLAAGNVDIAESAYAQAETYADYAADKGDVAADYQTDALTTVADAEASLDTVDYSALDTSTDYSTDYSTDSSTDDSADTTDYSSDL